MKRLIILLLTIAYLDGYAQNLQGPVGYGKQESRFKALNFLGIPYKDTICDLVENSVNGNCNGAIVLNPADSFVYIRVPGYWKRIGSISGIFASNGLHLDGDTVKLGGNYKGITSLDGAAGDYLVFTNYSDATGSNFTQAIGDGVVQLQAQSGSKSTFLGLGMHGDALKGGRGLYAALDNSDGRKPVMSLDSSGFKLGGKGFAGALSGRPAFEVIDPQFVFNAEDSSLTMSRYKNNPSRDSILSTDQTGRVVLKRLAPEDVNGLVDSLLIKLDAPRADARYILNNNSSPQSAHIYVNGNIRGNNFRAYHAGSSSIDAVIQVLNPSLTRGFNFQLGAENSPGLDLWVTNGFGSWMRRWRVDSVGQIYINNVPAMGSSPSRFLTLEGEIIKSRTNAQVLSDIAAAPSVNAIGYIWKQNSSPQPGASSYIDGFHIAAGFSTVGAINTRTMTYYGGSSTPVTANLRFGSGLYTSESGGNTGSNWRLIRYDDAGTFVSNVIMITRATGNVGLSLSDNNEPSSRVQAGGSVAFPIDTLTGTSTLTTAQHTVLILNSGAATITLPDAATCRGRFYVIKKISAASNNVIVATTGGQTVDGTTGPTLTNKSSSITFQSDGTNWQIVGDHISSTTY